VCCDVDMIFYAVETVQVATFSLVYACDVSKQCGSTVRNQCPFSVFRAENNLVKDLSKRAHGSFFYSFDKVIIQFLLLKVNGY
jgi:hypothetical protein